MTIKLDFKKENQLSMQHQIQLYANIIKATEKHEKTCAIFLDFAKA